jgi:hypothetical protein
VFARSLARCRAGSCMGMARYLYRPLVHCTFCERRFPGVAGYTALCSVDFLPGTRRASPVA